LRHKPHVDLIFEATKEDVVALGMDPFGNYLVQKLVQYGTSEQRAALIDGTVERMVEVALNVHGTRVVQKMVECADTPAQQSALCAALLPSIMQLIRDMNANHVVQRCLAALPAQLAAGIYNRAVSDCLAIATHRHGCCVLQRCLDHAPASHREEIIGEVVRLAPKLVVDPFGNYVVQYILDLRQPPLTHAIVQALRGGFSELSLQKFSSNVIEKCLKSGDMSAVAVVAEELTASEVRPPSPTPTVPTHTLPARYPNPGSPLSPSLLVLDGCALHSSLFLRPRVSVHSNHETGPYLPPPLLS